MRLGVDAAPSVPAGRVAGADERMRTKRERTCSRPARRSARKTWHPTDETRITGSQGNPHYHMVDDF